MRLPDSARAGFALMTVLWLVVVLSAVLVSLVAPLRLASDASANRTALIKASWAARSCVSLLRSEATSPGPWSDSISLGETVWCGLESLRPDERVHVNVVDSLGLSRLLRDPVRVSSLLDWIDSDDDPRDAGAEADWYHARLRSVPRNGPIADPLELSLVRGFEEIDPRFLEQVFTTRGNGGISPNRAPRWALESISGVPAGMTSSVVARRPRLERLQSAEQLVAELGLAPTIPEFREMVRRLSFSDGDDVVRATGHVSVGRAVVRSSFTVTIRRDRDRIHVLDVEAR